MQRNIIAYENGKIFHCNHNDCSDCDVCEAASDNFCSQKHYKELRKLCNDNKINCIKKENEHLKCEGYTGYFQLSDGTEVYILPKVDTEDYDTSINIFTNLVESAYNITKIKTGNASSTQFDKERIFIEILIRLFCSYMDNLFKKGLKKHYSLEEDNLPYLKGKIKFSEHIKRNIVSKEKFYVEYDEFTEDIPENRILRTTCNYLIHKINSFKQENNKTEARTECLKKLKRYIQEFGDIEDSKNLVKDFSKLQKNRLYEHYDKPLIFAKAFLSHKNYWINRGKTEFPAIMFSLHDLFEDYVQKLLKEFKEYYELKPQYSMHYLLRNSLLEKLFKTKMDFVLWNKDKSKYIILDAKYKLINLNNDIKAAKSDEEETDEEKNYYNNKTHISQSDLYQVFAYSELIKNDIRNKDKIPEVEIALLYPARKDKFEVKDGEEPVHFHYFNGTKITFIPIDLTGDSAENELEKNKVLKEFITSVSKFDTTE